MKKSRRALSLGISLGVLGILASGAQAASDRPPRDGYVATSSYSITQRPCITIDGRRIYFNSRDTLDYQIICAFRACGYDAWSERGSIRVRYSRYAPRVSWLYSGYSLNSRYNDHDLIYTIVQIRTRDAHRCDHRCRDGHHYNRQRHDSYSRSYYTRPYRYPRTRYRPTISRRRYDPYRSRRSCW